MYMLLIEYCVFSLAVVLLKLIFTVLTVLRTYYRKLIWLNGTPTQNYRDSSCTHVNPATPIIHTWTQLLPKAVEVGKSCIAEPRTRQWWVTPCSPEASLTPDVHMYVWHWLKTQLVPPPTTNRHHSHKAVWPVDDWISPSLPVYCILCEMITRPWPVKVGVKAGVCTYVGETVVMILGDDR